MALVPYTVTALAESDAEGTNGKNIVENATVLLKNSSGQVTEMSDDEFGLNPSTSKFTGSNGQVVIYAEPGKYTLEVNGSQSKINIGSTLLVDDQEFKGENNFTGGLKKDGADVLTQTEASNEFALKPYNTLSDAENDDTLKANDLIKTLGNQSVNDGGGAAYIVNNSLELELLNGQGLSIESIGAVGDGLTDNKTAFEVAYSLNFEFTANGDYLTTSLESLPRLKGKGNILFNGLSIPIEKRESKESQPYIYDMHFKALRGWGWSGETGSGEEAWNEATVTTGASKGDFSITVDDASLFSADQLVCLFGDNEIHFSNVISGISTNTITFKDPLEHDILVGGKLYNFYKNTAHPSTKGYYAIADDILNKPLYQKTLVREIEPRELNGGVLSALTSNSYANAGNGGTVSAYTVTTNSANEGVFFELGSELEAGEYLVEVEVNTGGNTLTASIITDGGFDVFKNDSFYQGSVKTLSIPMFVFNDGRYTANLFNPSGTGAFFTGNARLYKLGSKYSEFNKGKHVLLGDSWFFQTGIEERLIQKLPNAQIVNKGIGGNTAQVISNRFDSDVAPEKPDTVWLVTGTNDYYANITAELFSFWLNKLKVQCRNIGADLIIITSSVGDKNIATDLSQSREYAKLAYYYSGNYVKAQSAGLTEVRVSIPPTTVAAGANVRFGFECGIKDGGIEVIENYFNVNVDVVQTDNIAPNSGSDTTLLTLNSGYNSTTRTTATTANRWVCLKYINGTGAPVTFNGYAIIKI